ncbi:class I SAM-dependent methyltransferase [Nitrobacter sp. NHB1]|uniref:class I SAM-dependent methyltransferase n=1 Tax=Nitrobacter sp. NHB1 TaxID=3119830 RepID=UPI002FFF4488
MIFRNNFLRRYLDLAPGALAVERAVECDILKEQEFVRPILDIGCGDGIFAAILFDEKLDTGIDLDPAEVARAEKLDAYHELLVCPGDRIPKPDQAFNTVLSNSVIEHIPDLMPVLREAHRLLAPNGQLFLTIPTDRLEHNSLPARVFNLIGADGLEARYGSFHNRFWQHYNVHSRTEWRELFATAGFQVDDERLYASPNFSSFYDLLMPFALPSIAAKRLFGRWFLLPGLRRYYAGLVYGLIVGIYRRFKREAGSSLVFYALRKV